MGNDAFPIDADPPPSDWQAVLFEECCARVADNRKPSECKGKPYLGLEHLQAAFPALLGVGDGSDITSAKTAFRSNDILFGKLRPYLRKGLRVGFDGVCSTDILAFRPKPGTRPDFLGYLIHTDAFVEQAMRTTSGVNHPRTSWDGLRRFLVFRPRFDEQRQIAALLSAVQRAIERQERLVALTAELKKAVLHKLFTEGTCGEPLEQTEIGPIPRNWQVVKLGNAVDYIDYGISAPIPKTAPPDGVKIVSTADITKNGEILYGKIRRLVAPARTVQRLTLKHGDVLFNWRNSSELIGKSAVFEEQAEPHVFASFILRIRCDEVRSHNAFLSYLMNYYREQGVFIKLSRRAVNQANYNRNEISVLGIPLPPIDEQREIARAITTVVNTRSIHVRRRDALQLLFGTLLHQLMTAKIRVHDLDLSALQEVLREPVGAM